MDEIKTILLVDDNKTTLHLNGFLLKEFFPEENIYAKSSGQDAIDFIKKNVRVNTDTSIPQTFALAILADLYKNRKSREEHHSTVQMPDFGGWDLVNYLKSDQSLDMDQIYIVLLSAYVQPKDTEQKCAEHNVICINKPLLEENIEEIKQTFALAF